MKKFITIILLLFIIISIFTACGNTQNSNNSNNDKTLEASLEDIIDSIYEVKMPELMLTTNQIDISDVESLTYFTGLTNNEKIKEAVSSEPMINAQAYSLVLLRLADSKD